MPAGRPSDYTPELAAVICGRMSSGESVRRICRDDDMPNASTIFLWLSKHEEFSKQYAQAADARADALFEESLEIADDGTNDWMERRSEAEKGAGVNTGWVLNGEHVQRSRLRVDTRKWMVGKMQPKKYGDKVQQEISGPGGAPIQTETVRPQLTREEWLKLHGV